jgi:hypothetical protein
MAEKYYSLTVFVPVTHGAAVRAALAAAGAGSIGNYDSCSFTSNPGVGRFRPLAGARPHIGTIGLVEEVLEERIETEVSAPRLSAVLSAVRAAHPYEAPALHLVELHALGFDRPPLTQLASLEARVAALEAALSAPGAPEPPASLVARLERLELSARLAAAAPASPGGRAPLTSEAAAAAAAAEVEGRLAAAEELMREFGEGLASHTEALEEHSEWLASLERARDGAGAAQREREQQNAQ